MDSISMNTRRTTGVRFLRGVSLPSPEGRFVRPQKYGKTPSTFVASEENPARTLGATEKLVSRPSSRRRRVLLLAAEGGSTKRRVLVRLTKVRIEQEDCQRAFHEDDFLFRFADTAGVNG